MDAPGPASLVVLAAVCGNDLECRCDVAAVACPAIVTGALLAAGLKTRGG